MKRAFTLLELLVAIVIIGLVLAMLLPTMGRVREGARRVQCMNNLRQHGIAWYLYLDDHDECFPVDNLPPSAGGATKYTFGGKQGSYSFYDENYDARWRVLNRYVDIRSEDDKGALEIFHCPSDMKPAWPSPSKTNFDYRGNSYLFNPLIINYNSRPRPLSTITSPRNKVYLEMCNYGNKPGHGRKGQLIPKIPVMVLFVDGHVAGPFLYNADFESYKTNTSKPVIQDPNGPDAD